ncbi:hypothetical protein BT96DRAFT_948502 [Gymnopus androsaceus JB14]|uniref:Uncharacterized protein n=1 Tax=Gymnopus androsaceus JB14 TaxID=1447944 RepID=A0A6A4GPQ1_9AGAR|nr:hypothetical protein BT96DRAFT_948502 [Gymnopus androsaceus JB14]
MHKGKECPFSMMHKERVLVVMHKAKVANLARRCYLEASSLSPSGHSVHKLTLPGSTVLWEFMAWLMNSMSVFMLGNKVGVGVGFYSKYSYSCPKIQAICKQFGEGPVSIFGHSDEVIVVAELPYDTSNEVPAVMDKSVEDIA